MASSLGSGADELNVELVGFPALVQVRIGLMGALMGMLRSRGTPPIPAVLALDEEPGTPEEVLARALQLFGPNGERWVQHKRRDRGRFCAIAAIEEAAHGDTFLRRQAEERLRATVGRSPMLWNDSPGKQFSEIRAGFAAAIASDRVGMLELVAV
jgi:hypothetical protein